MKKKNINNKKISIYVVTHKEVTIKTKNIRKIIGVGNNKFSCDLRDNTGDNISNKNSSYCELTAMYWIWKNDKESDVVGLEHYRRLFISKKFQLFNDVFLTEKEINKILLKYDVIVPKIYIIKDDNKCLFDKYKVGENNHVYEDIDVLHYVFKNYFPQYYQNFDNIMFNQSWCYPYNMLICDKKTFNEYCEWLFPILEKTEEYIDISCRNGNKKRVFGYLSERLLSVWLDYTQKKVYENKVYYDFHKGIGKFLRRIRRNFKKYS